MNTKITKADFKRHFHYEWPKYLFAAFLACFGWYIIFTITNQVLETEELIIFVGACGINSETKVEQDLLNDLKNFHLKRVEINHHYINEIDFPLILLTAGVENSDILILDHDSFELFLTSGLAVPISSKILEKISIDDEYNFYFKDEKPLAIKIYESMNSSTNIHTNFSWLDFKCDEKDRTFYLVINQNSAFYKKDDLDVILEAITYLLK